MIRALLVCCAALALGIPLVRANEADALAISANIQARHLPFGTVIDPVYASSTSSQITGYTRCGDSALWTGAWLAAEAFRYKVTQSPDALANVKAAVAGIKGLVDVTGTNLLARCMVPVASPYAAGIESEESHNGIYPNSSAGFVWVGNTSRDEYVGVMFGLGAAYDLVDDAGVKSSIGDLVTRLVRFLTGHNWSVVLPDGSSGTTFLVRPDEQLGLVQVARHVNPDQFSLYYDELRILLSPAILLPVQVDVASDDSYFKFNLDYMNFYNLNRLEASSGGGIYGQAYSIVRNHTAKHQNAFFDVIDRALSGPDALRDTETLALLYEWLQRPRRDLPVDLTNQMTVCGGQACQPIPVPLRVPTDFLWQRSPFQLTGGGKGTIETAGIDYILPYWMARYYGIMPQFTVQSAAATSTALAPESLASLFGVILPPPSKTGAVAIQVKDSTGIQRDALVLYASGEQVNFEVPKGTAEGTAFITVFSGGASESAPAVIRNVAPTLFSLSGNGMGLAAATAIRTQIANPALQSPVPVFQCFPNGCAPVPIDVGLDAPVYLTLYGTGIRNRSSLSNVQVAINGTAVPVLYAGPQPDFPGLDQVNVLLTLNLRGSGLSNVILTVDGQTSNAVTIAIQ